MPMVSQEETLVEAALRVLNTADPFEKARLGDSVASRWLNGDIAEPYDPSGSDLTLPDRPARLSSVCTVLRPHLLPIFSVRRNASLWLNRIIIIIMCWQVKLVAPSLMPKLGRAGSLQSRIAIVHSLTHTESWAIDLSWVFICGLLIAPF